MIETERWWHPNEMAGIRPVSFVRDGNTVTIDYDEWVRVLEAAGFRPYDPDDFHIDEAALAADGITEP